MARTQNGDTFGWAILGFFLPLVGAMLFIAMMNSNRPAAMTAGKGAFIGFIVCVAMALFASCTLMLLQQRRVPESYTIAKTIAITRTIASCACLIAAYVRALPPMVLRCILEIKLFTSCR